MNSVRVAGVNFDHFHMGDLLRMAFEHPAVDVVGICDESPERMSDVIQSFGVSSDNVFTDCEQCLTDTKPDLVILCPAAAKHGEWTERVARFKTHILVEKPFAASLAEADRMIDSVQATDKLLAINWPLAWYPSHRTTKRLIDEGLIGEVLEVHYYDGNRGPLWHTSDKIARTTEQVAREKPESWFYKKDEGGGSLLDYLGYGTTLGTWFMNGRKPVEVSCFADQPKGLEVDEHSITVARYDTGLSKFETRWGTFSDPWTHQPQPKCGFLIVGGDGTIASYDYDDTIRVQTQSCPEGRAVNVDALASPEQDPVQYLVDVIQRGDAVEGPLSTAICRIGQQIVDSALLSLERRCPVPLVE
jgi:predicted dehydrogenase